MDVSISLMALIISHIIYVYQNITLHTLKICNKYIHTFHRLLENFKVDIGITENDLIIYIK